MSKVPREPLESVSFRFPESFIRVVRALKIKTGINIVDIFQISVLEWINTLDVSLMYEEIDLKAYANILRMEKKRKLHGRFRREHLSRVFFVKRVRIDLYKMVLNKSNLKDVKNYVSIRLGEAKNYKDSDEIITELQNYLNMDNSKYNDFAIEVKKRLMDYHQNRTIGEALEDPPIEVTKNVTTVKTKKVL